MIFKFLKRLFCLHIWEYEWDEKKGAIVVDCRECGEGKMSLVNEYIDSLGGYEAAKEKAAVWLFNHGENWRNVKEATLLEYRRANNIFESGDWVVLDREDDNKIYQIDYEMKNHCGHKLVNDKAVSYSLVLRHATDEEIRAGKRL